MPGGQVDNGGGMGGVQFRVDGGRDGGGKRRGHPIKRYGNVAFHVYLFLSVARSQRLSESVSQMSQASKIVFAIVHMVKNVQIV